MFVIYLEEQVHTMFKKVKYLPRTVNAITLWPFVFYKGNLTADLVQHELVHLRQQRELLVIGFYILYGLEWFIKLFIYGKYAYWHLSFEEEAYNWKKGTKPYGWIKYICA